MSRKNRLRRMRLQPETPPPAGSSFVSTAGPWWHRFIPRRWQPPRRPEATLRDLILTMSGELHTISIAVPFDSPLEARSQVKIIRAINSLLGACVHAKISDRG